MKPPIWLSVSLLLLTLACSGQAKTVTETLEPRSGDGPTITVTYRHELLGHAGPRIRAQLVKFVIESYRYNGKTYSGSDLASQGYRFPIDDDNDPRVDIEFEPRLLIGSTRYSGETMTITRVGTAVANDQPARFSDSVWGSFEDNLEYIGQDNEAEGWEQFGSVGASRVVGYHSNTLWNLEAALKAAAQERGSSGGSSGGSGGAGAAGAAAGGAAAAAGGGDGNGGSDASEKASSAGKDDIRSDAVRSSESIAASYLISARSAYSRGDYQEARRLANIGLNYDPDNYALLQLSSQVRDDALAQDFGDAAMTLASTGMSLGVVYNEAGGVGGVAGYHLVNRTRGYDSWYPRTVAMSVLFSFTFFNHMSYEEPSDEELLDAELNGETTPDRDPYTISATIAPFVVYIPNPLGYIPGINLLPLVGAKELYPSVGGAYVHDGDEAVMGLTVGIQQMSPLTGAGIYAHYNPICGYEAGVFFHL